MAEREESKEHDRVLEVERVLCEKVVENPKFLQCKMIGEADEEGSETTSESENNESEKEQPEKSSSKVEKRPEPVQEKAKVVNEWAPVQPLV